MNVLIWSAFCLAKIRFVAFAKFSWQVALHHFKLSTPNSQFQTFQTFKLKATMAFSRSQFANLESFRETVAYAMHNYDCKFRRWASFFMFDAPSKFDEDPLV